MPSSIIKRADAFFRSVKTRDNAEPHGKGGLYALYRKELADHIQYFFAGVKLYAQKGSKIVSVSYDGKEVRVFKKDVVMMDKKEDKVYYRRMDQKKEQMYVCDVDGGMEKTVGNEAGKD